MEASHVGVAPNQNKIIPKQVIAGGEDIQGERKGNEERDGQTLEVLTPLLGGGGVGRR
jgi:hypothetical protein